VDVGHRLSEEKLTIPYSKTESGILEVIENLCDRQDPVLFGVEEIDPVVNETLEKACQKFVYEYEDHILKAFYNKDFPEASKEICIEKLKICPSNANLHDEL